MTKILRFSYLRVYRQFDVLPRYLATTNKFSRLQAKLRNSSVLLIRNMSDSNQVKSGVDAHEKWYTRSVLYYLLF